MGRQSPRKSTPHKEIWQAVQIGWRGVVLQKTHHIELPTTDERLVVQLGDKWRKIVLHVKVFQFI